MKLSCYSLEIVIHFSGTIVCTLKVAFKSGWSKTGTTSQQWSGSGVDIVTLKGRDIATERIFDINGREFSADNLPSGVVIYVTEYDDGTVETRKEYRSN